MSVSQWLVLISCVHTSGDLNIQTIAQTVADKEVSFIIDPCCGTGSILESVLENKYFNIINELNSHFYPEKISKHVKIKYIDHHLSHLASSFYYSPLKNAVNVSVDGFGDFASCSWGTSNKNNILQQT